MTTMTAMQVSKMMKTARQATRFMQAAQWYEWHVDRRTVVETAYGPDHAEGYVQEKMGKLSKYGLLGLFAEMGARQRSRLVVAIIERYGEDAGIL